MDMNKEREVVHNAVNTLFDIAKVQKAEIDLLNVNIANKQAEIDELKAKIEKACKWSHDEDLNWWTQCGNGFVFGEDPHPAKHNFKHCCFCGGLIEAAQGEGHE